MYSYEKWGRLPRWDLTSFAGIPPRWDENFPYEHAQVGQRGQVDRVVFLSLFFFKMLTEYYKSICSA